MLLPEHKCGLYLTHNAYKDYHQSIENAVKEEDDRDGGPDWATTETRVAILTSGEFWELQWYPTTPVGFHRIVAESLAVLEAYAQA